MATTADKTVKVKLVRSSNGTQANRTAPPCAAWACASSNSVVELEDTPAVRGMINKVSLPGEGALSADMRRTNTWN